MCDSSGKRITRDSAYRAEQSGEHAASPCDVFRGGASLECERSAAGVIVAVALPGVNDSVKRSGYSTDQAGTC
jgi:hypothetical protein